MPEAAPSGADRATPQELIEVSRRLARHSFEVLSRQACPGNGTDGKRVDLPDPLGLNGAWTRFYAGMLANPARMAGAQMNLWLDYIALTQKATHRLLGLDAEPVITPAGDDRRFRDAAWNEHALFDLIKQSYLLTARAWMQLVADADHLDEHTRGKLEFATQQIVDALAPSNFAATNPEVWRATIESGGKNLLDGLNNLLDDLEESDGNLNVRMTDLAAFEVGKNIAVTPGKVIYQNELMQLIQYAPTTEQVHRRPLLIIPPWMNKFYVLDLRPGNSYVQWLVDQGHTVFIISWVNPGKRLGDKSFEDYMREGILAALDAVERTTGEREVNAVGYCLGGILLAGTMAWLTAKGEHGRVKSATYLTTMVDFSDVGDIRLFIDEASLESLEAKIKEVGYLDGRSVADTFRAIRANDLLWSFFVNAYLLGKSVQAFDILYWNADSTNMPAAMHTFFMRHMYLDNRMREPGGITLEGVPVDVTQVETPSYILSTREDHIAPWKTSYETTQLFKGPVKFVLGASGHIAGVVNPPQKEKYGYWTNSKNPPSVDAWLDGATEHKGSWWPDWQRWVRRHLGGKVSARIPGEGGLPAIEDAPGTYVLKRIEDVD
jgi:polyhydroxyalkanoate synthase